MRKWMTIAAACVAVAGASAWAMGGNGWGFIKLESREQLGLMMDAGSPADAAETRFERRFAAQSKAAALDVGDADSFGRDVKWLGTLSGAVNLRDCSPLEGQPVDPLCMHVDPSQPDSQFGEFRDLSHVTLPGGSTNSFLCHWLTPTIGGTFYNATGYDDRNARLTVLPSLTIENAALNAPGLVDPDTGLPLNGSLEVFLTSTSVIEHLDADEQMPVRYNASRTCIGGYVSKQALAIYYGLSEAQIAEFFRSPTTIRLNLQVVASQVHSGSVSYGIRFVGD
jgi:hypothetical protein